MIETWSRCLDTVWLLYRGVCVLCDGAPSATSIYILELALSAPLILRNYSATCLPCGSILSSSGRITLRITVFNVSNKSRGGRLPRHVLPVPTNFANLCTAHRNPYRNLLRRIPVDPCRNLLRRILVNPCRNLLRRIRVVNGHHIQQVPTQRYDGPSESGYGDSSWLIYSMYSKIAEDEDNMMVERCQKDKDGILIFVSSHVLFRRLCTSTEKHRLVYSLPPSVHCSQSQSPTSSQTRKTPLHST